MADNGTGQFGGNGSVWWRVVHGSSGKPGSAMARVAALEPPPQAGHWVKAGDTREEEVMGHHPVPVTNAGGNGHRGKFKVTVHYTTSAQRAAVAGLSTPGATGSAQMSSDATAAVSATMRDAAIADLDSLIKKAQDAKTALQKGATDVYVDFNVPIQQRHGMPTDWEVSVDW